MPVTGEALIDASMVYGAMRVYRGIHDDQSNAFRGRYNKAEDQLLFLEFLHHLLIYDRVVLESSNSHLELHISEELSEFIDIVNDCFPPNDLPLSTIQIGRDALKGSTHKVQQSLCKLIHANLSKGLVAIDTIKSIKTPYLYRGDRHHDYNDLRSACDAVGLSYEVLPFTLFVWRGLLYSAIARRWSRSQKKRVAYIAAPGRLIALRAILNAGDVAKFEYPREILRELSASLPNLSVEGYEFSDIASLPDFSGLSSLPVIETSSLSAQIADLSPDQALREIGKLRTSGAVRAMRDSWTEMLFQDKPMCGVGATYIQIVRDATVHGDLVQEQKYIRAAPASN